MKLRILTAVVLGSPAALLAQTPAAKKAATLITEADVRRHIGIIADDSMGGRDTPSPGLEKTALWVANEFKRLGLVPAGDSGGYLQRYPINVATQDADSSFIRVTGPQGQVIILRVGPDLLPVNGIIPGQLTTAGLVIVAGPIDSAGLAMAELKDQLVIWVADWSKGVPADVQATIGGLMSKGPRGVLALVNSDSVFAAIGGGAPLTPIVLLGPPGPSIPRTGTRFIAAVTESRIVRDVPEAADQFAQLHAATTTTISPLPDWRAEMISKQSEPVAATLPNTVGILEGTDPTLKHEYVVFSAHMDHVGSRCSGATPADRICNGADDDASGTVGVVALAAAFASPGARPKRSLIFLGVSGEERGLWGSDYFGGHAPVAIKSIVADLNMDMIGRNWKDTIVAIGKVHSDLGATADEITRENADLGMKIIDDIWPEENLYFRSDHYNFAKRGVPILFFTSGLHADYHAVTDSPEKIDAEKEARVLKLVYLLGQTVANRTERPKWHPASYQKIVKEAPVP